MFTGRIDPARLGQALTNPVRGMRLTEGARALQVARDFITSVTVPPLDLDDRRAPLDGGGEAAIVTTVAPIDVLRLGEAASRRRRLMPTLVEPPSAGPQALERRSTNSSSDRSAIIRRCLRRAAGWRRRRGRLPPLRSPAVYGSACAIARSHRRMVKRISALPRSPTPTALRGEIPRPRRREPYRPQGYADGTSGHRRAMGWMQPEVAARRCGDHVSRVLLARGSTRSTDVDL